MSLMDVGCGVVAVAFGWLFWRQRFFGFALDLGFDVVTVVVGWLFRPQQLEG